MSTRTLKLTLTRPFFEVMVTGEKNEEYRDPSAWIESRLFHGQAERGYDFVEFTNGYGKDKPRFTARYQGVQFRARVRKKYSNGASVQTTDVYAILLGEIVSIENYSIPMAL